MATVYCMNTSVMVIVDNKLAGMVLKNRQDAIEMYMYVAGELSEDGMLDPKSGILN